MDSISVTDRLIGLIVSGFIYAALLSIPVYIVWLLIKALRKTAAGTEQIGQELKKLREEVQALRENLAGRSPK